MDAIQWGGLGVVRCKLGAAFFILDHMEIITFYKTVL